MDVTADTVVAEQLRSSYTATKADGTKITGSLGLASGFTYNIDGASLSPIYSGNNITASGVNSYNNGIYFEYGASKTQLTCTANVGSAGYVGAGNLPTTATVPGSSARSYMYLQGVTLTAPLSGTSQFDITVPNGESTVTFHFSVDSSGNVTIT